MLQTQFLLTNAHFTLNLLTALVCFAVSWLYFDAWLGRHDYKESTKSLGFLLLSLSFAVHATQIEQTILKNPLLNSEVTNILTAAFIISAFLVLIIGQFVDPLQPLPSYRLSMEKNVHGFGIKKSKDKSAAILLLGKIAPLVFVPFLYPVLAIFTGFLYLRRATLGLEYHLRTIGYSLTILAISELLSLSALFRGSTNITLERIVGAFGPIWMVEHVLQLIFTIYLGRWVWAYLTKRLETQLFIIFDTVILIVFLLTAIFFTSVSLSNMRQDILANLETNVALLAYTIDGKKAETLSDVEMLSQNPELITALKDQDKKALTELTTTTLITKSKDFLVVVDENGAILARGDDPEKIGGSLSDDPLIKKALTGSSITGLVTKDGVMAPVVSVRAAAPVKVGEDIIGAVTIGSVVDNAFVDGLKNATGLDASVYADNIRSATTFIAPDAKSRWIGIKEENKDVRKTVLNEGNIYTGSLSILNIPYLVAFAPIKNIDENPIGMLFVGKPEVTTIQTASKLIEQTFIVTVGLLMLSFFPSYFVSRYIISEVK
ncbi:hypothetical protein A3A76_00065 [Candidatus Woesebacteria bacterium RIFCSPLOWO2_01_FULL_39_23]|uniref:Single cache domain-containing protein n=1 Tax=Candidatus Woesebacteria bacterium RIFCSPHIGHO2_01_FULL_40_22 TaxID=1802499 RepID=A0A1F7YHD4_9BACT|nr:MAG: hypothetical protein A2628_03685 [Candidatus Woesebacteria bacterium RIFCSPHIGHO2_01_FULL_40_22]OGM36647.1 MAG: hypothetical protein A3E41_01910 [Candidatus Woesebacteria bacterium RIFCSPHIGHO2_12_FULL_38_9]OGM62834.1 MAG: hypothetical protein A3A76_00065 [Candidatus Woesebacteria bacterium RIFCSPLOWO2_01_FULL_39_23]